MSQLPIQDVMPELLAGVAHHAQLILKAAPGAGKSTYFPLQLLNAGIVQGKIIMLEPRRLAVRNIAHYLAKQCGERVGQTVGYRMRGESKVSQTTQLEIVTEGILTRMIQSDPELSGVDMIIFDEFHERSLHADTALTLCLESQQALRDDLKLVVMSATLDQRALQTIMPDAAYVESHGRSYPIEYRYQPLKPNQGLEEAMAKQIRHLMATESGSLLAFLPGVAAIRRVAQRLEDLGEGILVCPLYGQLSFNEQQAAIAPAPQRKVVLATNIAETSLTIEGIRLVIDSGVERIAKCDSRTGITKLEQVRIAKSSAEQRAGRAGRIEPGLCVRLYSESQLSQQPDVPAPEMQHADLSGLAMELAQWGTQDSDELTWLTPPPKVALAQARQLLRSLGLLNEQALLTAQGQRACALGLEPRLAAMLLHSDEQRWQQSAVWVAALLEEPERHTLDFRTSVWRLRQGQHSKQKVVSARAAALAKMLAIAAPLAALDDALVPVALACAYPDRIAQQRSSGAGTFLLANGHGAQLDDSEPLADAPYLVVIDLLRSQSDVSRIHLAQACDFSVLEQHCPSLFTDHDWVDWDEKKGRLVAEKQKKLGAIVVSRTAMATPDKEKMTQALLSYVRRKGLSVLEWSDRARDTLERIRCAAQWLPEYDWPDCSDDGLLAALEHWLEPYMNQVTSVKQLASISIEQALLAYLGWPLNQQLDEWLPTHYTLPTGTRARIRYQEGQEPVLSVRIQEVYGEQTSPRIADGRKTLVLELLSPARRPLQITRDLAGFWAGSYVEVQKEMKGRYPKHVWPDDPANHVATTKTKKHLSS